MSRFLEQLLAKFCPSVTPLSSTKRSDPPLRRIIMNFVGSSAHKYGILDIQGYDDSAGAMDDVQVGLCSFPMWSEQIRCVWSNIFRIFYDKPPVLDTDGQGSILANCQMLVEKAEELHSTSVVSRAIQTTLVTFDQTLYQLISQDPVSWVKLAVCIQSGSIFQESMIHLVGKWGFLEEKARESLPKSVRTLCVQKIQGLNDIKKAVEFQIVNRLPHPRSDKAYYRETKNVYGWMALTFYQQWLCQSFAGGRNYHAPDGGAAFYRKIAAGDDSCLNEFDQTVGQLSASLEFGNEQQKELKKDLDELKKAMKHIVSDLLVNEAKYDPVLSGELSYLTCCQVREEEMPLPETLSYKLPGIKDIMGVPNSNTHIPNNNHFRQSFIPGPTESLMDGSSTMMGLNNNNLGNDFLLSPVLQNPAISTFDSLNTFTADPTMAWDDSMGYSSSSLNLVAPSLPSLSPMTIPSGNGLFESPADFDQFSNPGGNMNVFDLSITEDDNPLMQNGGGEGGLAFL
ncbi:uncharacterized protein APUU_70967S [Aspergillus puulaauensis]|uniref:Uncharacterized protein n=1 Tax=Aspergillus puulaauensis TaxID=1220207 RepID=A0A7R8ASQ0_9EURO|nr:uncharacterized protein APUU_70967S [Aspergillus puulaauensis]BCS29397.1 hypothetical protein APUU_70967S [Aspergillus puulaauensis]